MSYLGKVYKHVRDENFEAFLKSIGVPEERLPKIRDFKSSSKLEKDDDSYIITVETPEGTKVSKFKSGEQFDDTAQGVDTKTTFTVDGNTLTQVIVSDRGVRTSKGEYDGDNLKVTLTNDKWDGVAFKYLKA